MLHADSRLVSTSLALVVSACASFEEVAPAVPQRPSVSSDTGTAAEGTWEWEAGVGWDPDDSAGVPLSLKYGAGPATEVFLGWSPLVHLEGPPDDEFGTGDVQLGVRHRFREEEDHPSLALQATMNLPAADVGEGLGTGEFGFFLAGILTKGFPAVNLNAFYQADLLGDPEGGTELGHTIALAASRPLGDRWGGFLELAGIYVPGIDSDVLLATVGATWSQTPSMVWDMGLVLGLNDEAADLRLQFGFTQNLGR